MRYSNIFYNMIEENELMYQLYEFWRKENNDFLFRLLLLLTLLEVHII